MVIAVISQFGLVVRMMQIFQPPSMSLTKDIKNMFELLEAVKHDTDEILDRIDVLTKGTTILLQAAGKNIEEIRQVQSNC